ncbi:hypothetical protein HF086_002326 [Spodoptera exigua]|uniref:YqaJ viral recombinase domain-containing protein n=1 Tax=Spodoptera exigua TaxID=7107 RepID=A0A922SLG2_SPOEX|nr:hypothetical protein HF086_002326 [Spodoptera exigua]
MELGFTKANSSNLPQVDLLMLGEFLASNKDFSSAEFRNVKTAALSRPSYGDDAISYVQLKRDGNLCVVKAKICPEHKVHGKLYGVTLVVDEVNETVVSVDCHDCVASQGGCKHAVAFLMWVHRRSEKPSVTSVECYWMKSKLSRVGTTIKYMTAKDLSNALPSLPSNSVVLEKFIEEGRKRQLHNCELIKFQEDYVPDKVTTFSIHKLVFKYKEKFCECFLEKLVLTDADIKLNEEKTRLQSQSSLWYELSTKYPMMTGSPDGVCEESIIEIKCPISSKTYKNYVHNGKPTKKYYAQMQLQMYLSGHHKGYFCVADCNYNINKNVSIICVKYDEKYVSEFILALVHSWKCYVYPLLYQSVV